MKIQLAFGMMLALLATGATASAQSLWNNRNSSNPLRDTKASKVGDVLTVLIDERAEVSKESNRSTSKEASSQMGMDLFRLFGTEYLTEQMPALKYDSKKSFDGEAEFASKDSFTTRLSVLVKEVLPNGNLLVEGSRTIMMSGDETTVTITGIVRPRDIGAANTLPSELIADAKISYEGDGPAEKSTRKGWFLRVLDAIWPF